MGILQSLSFSSLWNIMAAKRQIKAVMIGLDGAGKTSIGNKLSTLEDKDTVPTIGFHVSSIEYKNISLSAFDVGGQKLLRNLWANFYEGCSCVLYVVDSNDRERIKEATAELHRTLEHAELARATVLIYANKQDLPHAVSVAELHQLMKIPQLQAQRPNRKIFIQGCCAPKGNGLYEGLDFLCSNLPEDQ